MSYTDIFLHFAKFEFPKDDYKEIVYAVGVHFRGDFFPFYIGETERGKGRVGDYLACNFDTPTDFKVGTAIKYLQSKGYRVVFLYKPEKNRKKEQNRLIALVKNASGRPELLNGQFGYDYKESEKETKRQEIHGFIDRFLSNSNLPGECP